MNSNIFQNKYDVIIIGSGIGGLTAGALLAKAGKRILLVEKHNRYGGYAQSFKRKGYHFDSSIHFTGGGLPMADVRQGIIYKTLAMLKVEKECEFLSIDPFCQIVLPEFTFNIPSEFGQFQQKLIETFPEEKKQIIKFLKLCWALDNDLRHLPDSSFFWHQLMMPFKFPRVVRYGTMTLARVLNLFFRNEKLKTVFAAFSACFATPIPNLSFAMWSHILVSVITEKVSYCKGTFQSLANTLARALVSYHGTCILNTEVHAIEVEHNCVKGIVLDNGSLVQSPVVISNADLRFTYEQLINPQRVPNKFLHYIRTLKPSLSCFSIYIGTDLPLHTMDLPHEIVCYDNIDFTRWFTNADITQDINMAIAMPNLTDKSIVPTGKHIVVILSFIPYRTFTPEERKEFRDFLIAKVNRIIPGLQDHLDFIETATPTTFERYTNNYKGAAFGWEPSVNQVGDRRPSLKSPITGLWHTGHWTRPGNGIYGVLVSGRKVAQYVLGYKNASDFVKAMNAIDTEAS